MSCTIEPTIWYVTLVSGYPFDRKQLIIASNA